MRFKLFNIFCRIPGQIVDILLNIGTIIKSDDHSQRLTGILNVLQTANIIDTSDVSAINDNVRKSFEWNRLHYDEIKNYFNYDEPTTVAPTTLPPTTVTVPETTTDGSQTIAASIALIFMSIFLLSFHKL